MKTIECKICNELISSNSNEGVSRKFNNHLKNKHNISQKNYYDKHIKSQNEGICKICGKEVQFVNIHFGYIRKTCSNKCSKILKNITWNNRPKEERDIIFKEAGRKVSENWNNKPTEEKDIILKIRSESIRNRPDEEKTIQIEKFKEHMKNRSDKDKKESRKKKQGTHQNKSKEEKDKTSKKLKDAWDRLSPEKRKAKKEKEIITKKENGTTKSSKIEKDLCEYFKNNNIIFDYQYNKDKRYPFACDFYFPNKDLFVEINGYYQHGKEPFDINNWHHINKLTEIADNAINDNGYCGFIDVWTNRDPIKFDTARLNNLNYLVIYS